MPLYEHVFLARQDVSTQQIEGLLDTFRALIEEMADRSVRPSIGG